MIIKNCEVIKDENGNPDTLAINAKLEGFEESKIEVEHSIKAEKTEGFVNGVNVLQHSLIPMQIREAETFGFTINKNFDEKSKWYECYLNKEIPEYILSGNGRKVLPYSHMELRNKIASKVGYVLLTWEMLRHLKSDLMKYCETYLGKRREDDYTINILELGCGVGSFAFALRQLGVNVIAVDDYSRATYAGEYGVGFDYDRDAWIPDIINMDNEAAVREYGKGVDFILISWPEYASDSAYKSLLAMREVNPNACMIYVGERAGGCTADDDFFENVKYVGYNGELSDDEFDNWFAKTQECFRTWYGIYDSVYLVK